MNKLLLIFIVPVALLVWGIVATRTEVPETSDKTYVTHQTAVVEKPLETHPAETYTLLDLTNQERIARGLGALALKQSLIDSAKLKCLDMQTRNYWAHSINNESVWKDFTDSGNLGENLARTNETPQKVFEAWMNSPTHRDNILSPNFTKVGFASCEGPQNHLIVQHFWGK